MSTLVYTTLSRRVDNCAPRVKIVYSADIGLRTGAAPRRATACFEHFAS
jgi:hypothetical protein